MTHDTGPHRQTAAKGQGPTAVLVRHAHSVVNFDEPSKEWPLSDAGLSAARSLAATIGLQGPAVVVTSPERKALQTATVLAAELGLRVEIDDRLREHEAPGYLAADEFQAAVQDLFARSDEAVFGETARGAAARFAEGLSRREEECFVAVSHGRVMSAYLARLTGTSGWRIWQDLAMPDALRLTRDGNGLTNITRLTSQRPPEWFQRERDYV